MTAKNKTITEAKAAVSKGQATAADVSALLRARNPALWVTTREETRVENFLVEAAAAAGYKTLFWDVAAGVTDISGKQPVDANARPVKFKVGDDAKEGNALADPGLALLAIRELADKKIEKNGNGDDISNRTVWVLRDLPAWLEGTPGATPLRQIRNLAKYLPGVPRISAQAIIILTTSGKVPADLKGHTSFIDWPLPDRSEIAKGLDASINNLPEFEFDKETGKPDTTKPLRANATTPETRELAIDAALGLTAEEAASCFAKSIIIGKTIDPKIVSAEKKRVIAGTSGLEWHDPILGGLDAVGGLDNLKDWLAVRQTAYTPAAREYGLPAPKGIALVGISGCGKSLTAKCTATAWSVPLLKLDLGAQKSKYVGDSEASIRNAFKVIRAIGHCVVWIDEIEKAMAGSSSGASDGGVSSDALSVVLTWMQDRDSEAFVIATANNIENLPPELFRKGRFDEVFYVGLPNAAERKGVIKAALRANGRGNLDIDFAAVVKATDKFTGAEIAELVPTALYVAYGDDAREPTTKDLIDAARDVRPLSKTRPEIIDALEKWGAANARPATAGEKVAAARLTMVGGRDLDLE